MYSLKQIAEITETTLVGSGNRIIKHFLNDSRNLQSPSDSLFVALKTPRNNGHQYIGQLVKNGVKAFLVMEDEVEVAQYPDDVSFLISRDPLRSLQNLAAYHRQQFNIPVIGITGSNGKTVVKEWLNQLLKNKFSICRSPKSHNSQIGVPLSVLNLSDSHTLAIFEAGISQPGEMENLASIIRPTIGVFTSIGSAHDEGFQNREQKISEKMKLLDGCDVRIINGIERGVYPETQNTKAIFIGMNSGNDYIFSLQGNSLKLVYDGKEMSFNIPFSDEASLSNAATCAVVLMQLGMTETFIAEGLKNLQPVALRLEIKNAIHNSLVINDYYNSDLDSLRIALSYLKQQSRKQRKVLVLSDIEQSGIPPQNLYRTVAELISANNIELLVGIGSEISKHQPLFKNNSLFYPDTGAFIQQFGKINHQFSGATILLKGARSFGFESVSRLLQQKSHDTVFEINLDKLTENVNYYRSLVGNQVQIMCMVKAMGYGSGGAEIAKTLQHIGVNYLAVAYADEGVELRQSQINLPIMVMNPEEDAFDDIVNYRLEPEIYNFRVLRTFVQRLDALGLAEPYPVHIKIDTGMHRLGFEEKDLAALALELKHTPQLKVRSVFSHLSGSDNPLLDGFTREQVDVFGKAFHLIEKELGYPVIKHICNSGAITRHPYAHYDMVRLGIGMYGIGVNAQEQVRLQNVGSLKTRISQIKKVQGGQTVSYNRSGKIESERVIATIPIGYADGFNRALGNGKHGVYISGKFCMVVGSVCMDMCMVDVTGVECEEGDEVVIFETTQQINTMATAMNTIAYEVLTSVSGRVKRVYVKE